MTEHFWMRRKELLGNRNRKVYAGSRLARDLDSAALAARKRAASMASASRRLAAVLDRMAA